MSEGRRGRGLERKGERVERRKIRRESDQGEERGRGGGMKESQEENIRREGNDKRKVGGRKRGKYRLCD